MNTIHSADPLRITEPEAGLRVIALARPKANILDAEMVGALTRCFEQAKDEPDLKAIVLSAEGPHFSFGASIEEHMPDQVASMLQTFHGLFRAMAASRLPALAAIRGQCLGGGLELVSFAHRVFAAPDSKLGQPEIKLGVIAPMASAVLPTRIGRSHAEDLCLSGRSVDAEDALRIGLVDEIHEDPVEAAVDWARRHVLQHSATSLRLAQEALRREWYGRLFPQLDELERLYLEELMATKDAEEGLRSFLDKRRPEWRNQ